MNSDPEQFRERSRTEMFFDFLRARFLSIVAVLLVGVGIAMSIGFDLSIPRWVRLVGFTAIAFAPLGFIFGNWLVGILHDPNYQFLVDLDATRTDGGLYQLPPEDFRELEVTDENGNPEAPYDITQLAPSLYAGKQIDLDELTCVGTWRGTLDDRGFVLETSAFTIVRSAARGAALDVVEMFQSGTLPDQGASINEAVDNALEDFGFEEEVESTLEDLSERADLNEEPEPEQPEVDRRREHTNGAERPTPQPTQPNE